MNFLILLVSGNEISGISCPQQAQKQISCCVNVVWEETMQVPHKYSCAYHQENLQSGLHKLPANRGVVRKFQGGKELGLEWEPWEGLVDQNLQRCPLTFLHSSKPAPSSLLKRIQSPAKRAEKGDQEINFPWRKLRMECYKRLHIQQNPVALPSSWASHKAFPKSFQIFPKAASNSQQGGKANKARPDDALGASCFCCYPLTSRCIWSIWVFIVFKFC